MSKCHTESGIPFAKYSGCGNDFVIFDNRRLSLDPRPMWVKELCHRNHGIGADGIILLEDSPAADFKMRIINADGSEAEMCGNGVRCLAHFIFTLTHQSAFTIQTMHQHLEAHVDLSLSTATFGMVKIAIPLLSNEASKEQIEIEGKQFYLHLLDTGVPHAVIFVDDLDQHDHFYFAPKIRYHSLFHPRGTNVNFAKQLKDGTIAVRTYERGVEAETLACGTGAIATALAAKKAFNKPLPITIQTRSGDNLLIDCQDSPSNPNRIFMSGPAKKIYTGWHYLRLRSGFNCT